MDFVGLAKNREMVADVHRGVAIAGRQQYRQFGADFLQATRKAEAVLESFDGRFYTMRVTARDDAREIGRGTVGRAVVSIAKFVERMKAK